VRCHVRDFCKSNFSLFRYVTQRALVVADVSVQIIGAIFRLLDHRRWEPQNYKYTLRNTPREWFLDVIFSLTEIMYQCCRSQWPLGLRYKSAAARLLGLWVRIPTEVGIFVCCEWCAFSGRGLCDWLITHPEEFYQMWCVVVCDLETSRMRRSWTALGRRATGGK